SVAGDHPLHTIHDLINAVLRFPLTTEPWACWYWLVDSPELIHVLSGTHKHLGCDRSDPLSPVIAPCDPTRVCLGSRENRMAFRLTTSRLPYRKFFILGSPRCCDQEQLQVL